MKEDHALHLEALEQKIRDQKFKAYQWNMNAIINERQAVKANDEERKGLLEIAAQCKRNFDIVKEGVEALEEMKEELLKNVEVVEGIVAEPTV